ncbi:hypothetical protein NYV52_01390 [Escherichia coli]|nr:hypothetical protein [Escherichia coli]
MKKIKLTPDFSPVKIKPARQPLRNANCMVYQGQECYSKSTGRRCGSHDSLSRLRLDSIKPVE